MWRFDPLAKKGGGLWECGNCLLVFEESYFLMLPFDSCTATKDRMYREVELAQSHLVMVRTELDALQERHRSVVQRMSDLEKTLRGA